MALHAAVPEMGRSGAMHTDWPTVDPAGGGSALRAGLEMIVIGLTSAFAGYLVGQLLRATA